MRSWLALAGVIACMNLLTMCAVGGSAGAESPPLLEDAPVPIDAGLEDAPPPADAGPDGAAPVLDAGRPPIGAAVASEPCGCGVEGGAAIPWALVVVLAGLGLGRRRRQT